MCCHAMNLAVVSDAPWQRSAFYEHAAVRYDFETDSYVWSLLSGLDLSTSGPVMLLYNMNCMYPRVICETNNFVVLSGRIKVQV